MSARFVSYAQNFEDVIIWRALKHVGPGFYIDVGAHSPTSDSVTQAFYERGWRGINIEPNPERHAELVACRPEDINLRLAVADMAGDMKMHFVSNDGLSTLDANQARARGKEGYDVVEEWVRVGTLSAVWSGHVPPDMPVHFLKVDVEGFERQVLLGADWTANRPWIVVVEATLPMTTTPFHEAWESILTDARYVFAYKDGLNRFYVATEHRELLPAFEYPPNWFDEFVRISEVQANQRATAAEERRAVADERRAASQAELATVLQSRSWTITRPLRSAGVRVRRLSDEAGRIRRNAAAAIRRHLRASG